MSDWLTWQVVDSAFPTGLFAHSWGLESAWQHGAVAHPEALRRFVDACILQTGYAVMPFVNDVYRWPERLERLDDVAEAFLTNVVANRASRIQGRTMLATAGRIWPSQFLEALTARSGTTFAHVAPLSGAVLQIVGLPLHDVQRVTLHAAARGVLSAAVRLGIVGSYEAQRMQHACGPTLQRMAIDCVSLSIEDLAQTAPLIDLWQSGHDRLYSRLFQS